MRLFRLLNRCFLWVINLLNRVDLESFEWHPVEHGDNTYHVRELSLNERLTISAKVKSDEEAGGGDALASINLAAYIVSRTCREYYNAMPEKITARVSLTLISKLSDRVLSLSGMEASEPGEESAIKKN